MYCLVTEPVEFLGYMVVYTSYAGGLLIMGLLSR